MKSRLQAILHNYQLTAAEFAKIIGVNPSGLSHILSGNRNNLSMDTILKILKKYPDINLDWLVLGKGEMLKTSDYNNELFKDNGNSDVNSGTETLGSVLSENVSKTGLEAEKANTDNDKTLYVKKIIIVYSDNSFEELKPK